MILEPSYFSCKVLSSFLISFNPLRITQSDSIPKHSSPIIKNDFQKNIQSIYDSFLFYGLLKKMFNGFFLSGNNSDPIIRDDSVIMVDPRPISVLLRWLRLNVNRIGSRPINAVKPVSKASIAPVELALCQYSPPANNANAPVKYIAPLTAR